MMVIYDGNIWNALQVFSEGKLKCFVDGRGAAGSWMSYVNCARYSLEQNLNAIQVGVRNVLMCRETW